VDQVIVMAKPRVIMAYADPKEMLAGTNEVLSRCGPGFGAVKDVTLGTGAKAGVWSIARPSDSTQWPAFWAMTTEAAAAAAVPGPEGWA
jgi:hypothetical protein